MSATLMQLHIELTNRCNLNCIMCYRREMKVPKGEMDLSLFMKIVNQISCIDSIDKVFLHWRGEPTCCTYLNDAVEILCKKNIKVILFTNGILFDKTIAKRLIMAGIHSIFFSVEAITPETYAQIRGSEQFNCLLENITNSIAVRNEIGAKTHIKISTIIFENNMSQIASFDDYWKNIVDDIEYHIDTRDSSLLSSAKEQCLWPYHGLFISWNGIVSACCMDVNIAYPIGDLNKESIMDVFCGSAVNRLRSSLINRQPIGKCKTCNFLNYNN